MVSVHVSEAFNFEITSKNTYFKQVDVIFKDNKLTKFHTSFFVFQQLQVNIANWLVMKIDILHFASALIKT